MMIIRTRSMIIKDAIVTVEPVRKVGGDKLRHAGAYYSQRMARPTGKGKK
jgi:hypothetical protein